MCLHCINKVSHATSKAVVGADQSIKALAMHIQKPYKGIIVYVLQAVILSKLFFVNQTPSCICSMCLHCINKASHATSKAVVGVDQSIKALAMHIQKPYKGIIVYFLQAVILSKLFFVNQTPSCICSMCLQIVPTKAVVGVDRPMKAPSMHIQKPN